MAEVRSEKGRSMMPREHGAYAQLAFPLVTALALGTPNAAALLLLTAIVAAFLLNEPLTVLAGGRGGRAKRAAESRAWRRAAALLAVLGLAGAAGLWLGPPTSRFVALIPGGMGVLLLALVLGRRVKTAAGELLVSWTLPSAMIPVAVAGGVSPAAAITAAAVWAIAFSLGTLTVRSIIVRAKRGAAAGLVPAIAPAASTVVIAAALLQAATGAVPAAVAIAVVPTAAVALVFGLAGVHPRNLRRMGWSLVASNLIVLTSLVIGLR